MCIVMCKPVKQTACIYMKIALAGHGAMNLEGVDNKTDYEIWILHSPNTSIIENMCEAAERLTAYLHIAPTQNAITIFSVP